MIQFLVEILIFSVLGFMAGFAYSLVTLICLAGFSYQWSRAPRSEKHIILLAHLFRPTYFLVAFALIAIYLTILGDPGYSFWVGFWGAVVKLKWPFDASLRSAASAE